MFRKLVRLFTKRDRLTVLSRKSDRQAFIRALVETDVSMIADFEGEGLDADTLTEESLLAEIERTAKEASERDRFEPFICQVDETRFVPFFSTTAHAENFCGGFCKAHNRVFPFLIITVPGAALASLLSDGDALVLNPGSADAYVLSDTDIRLLEEAVPTSETQDAEERELP